MKVRRTHIVERWKSLNLFDLLSFVNSSTPFFFLFYFSCSSPFPSSCTIIFFPQHFFFLPFSFFVIHLSLAYTCIHLLDMFSFAILTYVFSAAFLSFVFGSTLISSSFHALASCYSQRYLPAFTYVWLLSFNIYHLHSALVKKKRCTELEWISLSYFSTSHAFHNETARNIEFFIWLQILLKRALGFSLFFLLFLILQI